MSVFFRSICLFFVVLLFQNCGGFQSSTPEQAGAGSTGGFGEQEQPEGLNLGKFTCEPSTLRGQTEGKIRRLTQHELRNSLKVIFGNSVVAASESTIGLYPRESFPQEVESFSEAFGRAHLDSLVNVALDVARHAVDQMQSNDSNAIVSSGSVSLPLDPNNTSQTLTLASPSGSVQAIEIEVLDADNPNEGLLYINNQGPIQLFPPGSGLDAQVVTVRFDLTPAQQSWFQAGDNQLRFTHETSLGYRVDGVRLIGSGDSVSTGGSLFPSCMVAQGGDFNIGEAQCVGQFIDDLGLLLFRRPVISRDRDHLLEFLGSLGEEFPDNKSKVAALISQMILHPYFSFHISQSEEVVGDRERVDIYTLISRMSYRLTGAGPDRDLMAAARNGEISGFGDLESHARRLIASPLGRDYVRNIFHHWLKIGQSSTPKASYGTHLGVQTAGLPDAMSKEALDFAEHITFELQGSFQDLLNSNLAFPGSADLAKLMGTRTSSGVKDPQVVRDGRRGLYMRPVLFLAPEARTSVIHRGYLFNKQFLCRDIPAPSAEAIQEGDDLLAQIDPLTMTARDEATFVTSPTGCAGCHNSINPPGFAFERFGSFGQVRQQEEIFNANDELVRSLEIDDSLTDFTLDGQLRDFASVQEFNSALQTATDSQACFSQKLFRFSKLQMETRADHCHLAYTEARIRNGESIIDILVQNAMTEDILWQAKK